MSDFFIFFILIAILLLAALFLALYWWVAVHKPLALSRLPHNPVLSPTPEHWWESEAVFNPGAFATAGRVHLVYRAMGSDGISRVGYAHSSDGIHFNRLPYPVYEPIKGFGIPNPERRWGPLSYSQTAYPSGGGWGGAEDPRLVIIEDTVYMSFVAFDGWGFVRMALTSMPLKSFYSGRYAWRPPAFLSPPGEIHKNWVLFPEKVGGKYAILHSITPELKIEYVKDLSVFDNEAYHIKSEYKRSGREGFWDNWVRGAGPPPLKTEFGWLLFYHAMDHRDPDKYKLGVMLLDLEDPTRVLYRSSKPVLEPQEWYENHWKPGVVYASAAVVLGDDLLVYYGGGDKYVAVAKANLRDFVRKLASNQHALLTPVRV